MEHPGYHTGVDNKHGDELHRRQTICKTTWAGVSHRAFPYRNFEWCIPSCIFHYFYIFSHDQKASLRMEGY